jgi:hypothetical protein
MILIPTIPIIFLSDPDAVYVVCQTNVRYANKIGWVVPYQQQGSCLTRVSRQAEACLQASQSPVGVTVTVRPSLDSSCSLTPPPERCGGPERQ